MAILLARAFVRYLEVCNAAWRWAVGDGFDD